MIDHAVPFLSFLRPIIIDIPSAFFQRPDRSAPPDGKKPRQSLTGLCLLKSGRQYVLGGINDCLLPIESGASLAPWMLALSTSSSHVRTVAFVITASTSTSSSDRL
jgi:hypothetical protein